MITVQWHIISETSWCVCVNKHTENSVNRTWIWMIKWPWSNIRNCIIWSLFSVLWSDVSWQCYGHTAVSRTMISWGHTHMYTSQCYCHWSRGLSVLTMQVCITTGRSAWSDHGASLREDGLVTLANAHTQKYHGATNAAISKRAKLQKCPQSRRLSVGPVTVEAYSLFWCQKRSLNWTIHMILLHSIESIYIPPLLIASIYWYV